MDLVQTKSEGFLFFLVDNVFFCLLPGHLLYKPITHPGEEL